MLRLTTLLLTACLLAGGCASADVAVDDEPAGGSPVDRALAWDPPAAYEVELEVACRCPATRFVVRVRDGEVTSAVAVDETGSPADAPAPPGYATSIEAIQAALAATVEDGGTVTSLELGADGRPEVVGIDPSPSVVDDEVTWRILELRPG